MIYFGLFQNSHSVRMSIKRLFHFWKMAIGGKAIPLEHVSKFVVVKALSKGPKGEFSIFLQPPQVVCESLDFLRDTHCY